MVRKHRHSSKINSSRPIDFIAHSKGQLANQILSMINDGLVMPASLLMPVLPKSIRPLVRQLSKKFHASRVEAVIKSLSYLSKKQLVSIAERDGQPIITLTEKGKKHILEFNFDQLEIKRPIKWDGCWRVVLFDIPEQKKQAREALRNKLKLLGFFQLQKSCFVHPFDCKSEIDYISNLFEISPYVNYILAKELEGATQLRKIFHLT